MDRISLEDSLRWMQRFVGSEWQLVVPIALAFIGLPALVSTVVTAQLLTPVPQSMAEMQALAASMPWWLTPFALLLSLVMLTGGLALTALALLPQVSVGEAIRAALARLPATLAVVLLIWLAMLIALLLVGVVTAVLHLPQGLLVLATLLVMIAAGVSLLLLLPLLIDRHSRPLATIRAARRFYRGTALRLGASLILYVLVSFVAVLAAQVALGSVAMLVMRAAGQPEIGQLLAAILSGVITAFQGAGLFLLAAAFYRQRVGRS